MLLVQLELQDSQEALGLMVLEGLMELQEREVEWVPLEVEDHLAPLDLLVQSVVKDQEVPLVDLASPDQLDCLDSPDPLDLGVVLVGQVFLGELVVLELQDDKVLLEHQGFQGPQEEQEKEGQLACQDLKVLLEEGEPLVAQVNLDLPDQEVQMDLQEPLGLLANLDYQAPEDLQDPEAYLASLVLRDALEFRVGEGARDFLDYQVYKVKQEIQEELEAQAWQDLQVKLVYLDGRDLVEPQDHLEFLGKVVLLDSQVSLVGLEEVELLASLVL